MSYRSFQPINEKFKKNKNQFKSTFWTASFSPNHNLLGKLSCPFRWRGSGQARGLRPTCQMFPATSLPSPQKKVRQHTDRAGASTSTSLAALPTACTEGLRKIKTSSVHNESTQNNQPPAQVVTRDLLSHAL